MLLTQNMAVNSLPEFSEVPLGFTASTTGEYVISAIETSEFDYLLLIDLITGIETNLFFTFFGLEGITKKSMNHLHTATTGNPAMKMPGGLPFPTMLGGLPGVESAVSAMMRKQMDELGMPPVDEFLEMITAGGGTIYACRLAVDMFKLTKEDLSDEVKGIITIGEFYELCDGDRTQIIFT